MANKVRYGLRYDGMRYYGGRAVYMLKYYAQYYKLPWDNKKPAWQNCIDIFRQLPDYNKRLLITREPRHCRQGRFREMCKRNEVPAA